MRGAALHEEPREPKAVEAPTHSEPKLKNKVAEGAKLGANRLGGAERRGARFCGKAELWASPQDFAGARREETAIVLGVARR
jgi:hypothetical protein